MHCDASGAGPEMRIAAMAAGNVPDYRQSKARAGGFCVEPVEALEDSFLLTRGHAGALVRDFDGDAIGVSRGPGSGALDPRGHLATAVQNRVLEKVAHHVAQVIAVAADRD